MQRETSATSHQRRESRSERDARVDQAAAGQARIRLSSAQLNAKSLMPVAMADTLPIKPDTVASLALGVAHVPRLKAAHRLE